MSNIAYIPALCTGALRSIQELYVQYTGGLGAVAPLLLIVSQRGDTRWRIPVHLTQRHPLGFEIYATILATTSSTSFRSERLRRRNALGPMHRLQLSRAAPCRRKLLLRMRCGSRRVITPFGGCGTGYGVHSTVRATRVLTTGTGTVPYGKVRLEQVYPSCYPFQTTHFHS